MFKGSHYKNVFNKGNKDADLVLKDLIDFCGIYKSSFQTASPEETFYNEGKRRVGLRILSFINKSDSELKEIQRVNKKASTYDPFDNPFLDADQDKLNSKT